MITACDFPAQRSHVTICRRIFMVQICSSIFKPSFCKTFSPFPHFLPHSAKVLTNQFADPTRIFQICTPMAASMARNFVGPANIPHTIGLQKRMELHHSVPVSEFPCQHKTALRTAAHITSTRTPVRPYTASRRKSSSSLFEENAGGTEGKVRFISL